MTTERPLELLHMDIFGPIAYISLGGNKYDFIIVDDYSCFTWVFFLCDKSEVHGIFKKFAKRAQNEFGAERPTACRLNRSPPAHLRPSEVSKGVGSSRCRKSRLPPKVPTLWDLVAWLAMSVGSPDGSQESRQ